ncbi:outer membrane protein assembly factor BamB family protein [Taklimakanibacter lacteus]|uniref:outer membrane protein assembly factor BamB family protein n=1 Tax=Taklimakanibacter lacteus TaxID=2268456 RepID=UPI0013C40434
MLKKKSKAPSLDLRAFIEEFGVQRGPGIVSPSGTPFAWFIDMRRVFMRPEYLGEIVRQFWERHAPGGPVQIGGMEVAAIPLLTAILQAGHERGHELNGFMVRKERKTYGTQQQIEGELNDRPVILVDDSMNTGGSLEKARVALERSGRKVDEIFVVVDFQSAKGMAWRKLHNIKVNALFTLSDLNLTIRKKDPAPPQQKFEFVWRYAAETLAPFHVVPKSTPVIFGNSICLGTDAAAFVSVDLDSGKENWSYQAKGAMHKGIWSSAALHQGRLYFGAYNGIVYCLDARTGAEIWQSIICDWVGSSPLVVERHGVLIVGTEYEKRRMPGSMAGLSLATGEKLWEFPMRAYQHGSASYWPADDLAICGSADHSILALNPATGEKVWEFYTDRSTKYPPALDMERGLAVAASFDGYIYVVKAATGELVEKFKTDDICYTTPLITHGRIFCGSGDRHLYVIDLETMSLVKKMDCRARVYSSPRLVAGKVAFGNTGGTYRELDPISLQVTGYLQLPDAITNAIAETNGGQRIFIPTSVNELYCFERV